MDMQRPISMPPVVNGSGSDGTMPMATVKAVLPPVTNGSGGVGDPPMPRPLVLPPTVG